MIYKKIHIKFRNGHFAYCEKYNNEQTFLNKIMITLIDFIGITTETVKYKKKKILQSFLLIVLIKIFD